MGWRVSEIHGQAYWKGIFLLGACSSVLCPFLSLLSRCPPAWCCGAQPSCPTDIPSAPRAGFVVALRPSKVGEDEFPSEASHVPPPGRSWGHWGLSGVAQTLPSPCTPQLPVAPPTPPSSALDLAGQSSQSGAHHRAHREEPAPRWLPWDQRGQVGASLGRNRTGSAGHCTMLHATSEHGAQERGIPVPHL